MPLTRCRAWALAASLLLACGLAAAQFPSTQQFDAVFADLQGATGPGCAAGVERAGTLLYAAGHGHADITQERRIDANTVFNIASDSKQFTAFSILWLAQQGRLALDDSILDHVPELGAYAWPVTLRHLIHHTGGLRDYSALLFLKGRTRSDPVTQRETLEALARQRAADFPAGTRYAYSNTGYFLLGLVVERVSGLPMRSFAAKHLFAPLGMDATSIVDHYPADIAALARGYRQVDGAYTVDESRWEQTGDGQIHTTVRDLLRWSRNFHDTTLGGPALVRQMTAPGPLDAPQARDYAAGLVVRPYRGLRVERHGGSWAGYTSDLVRFPAQQLSIAVLCNASHLTPGRYAHAIADLVLAAELGAPEPAAPARRRNDAVAEANAWRPADPAAYAGRYWSPEGDVLWRVHACPDGLQLDDGLGLHAMAPHSPGVFRGGSRVLRFAADPRAGFMLRTRGLDALAFERRADTPQRQPVPDRACSARP